MNSGKLSKENRPVPSIRLVFILAILVLVAFKSLHAQVIIPDKDVSGSDIQSLNGTWKFKYIPSLSLDSDSIFYRPDFDIKSWQDIKVPGHWELQGFAEPRYGGEVKAGIGLYRRDFTVPQNQVSKELYLVFDGVLYGYDIWVNGRYAGTWGSSYNRMMFDITKYIVTGRSNTLAVKVTTRNKGWEFDTNDCWGLSGIYRDVTLIAVPQTHIKDLTVKTYINKNKSALFTLSVLLENSNDSVSFKNLAITGKLISPDGKAVKDLIPLTSDLLTRSDTATVLISQIVENPQLWSAETPWLYNLELILKSDEKEVQRIHQKIGIRQVSIEKGIFKLNGQAIKLRGVDHHDIDPIAGRALTTDMIIKDLVLMKQANINFIRTSHYPPDPGMIEYCDSMGIYVMCEVPFGFGDRHLTDTSYLDILLDRAKATVGRDKNHPSVIIWSIGNENPLTPIALKTGLYVKKRDNTRPICYPQMGSYFKNNSASIPDSVDLLSPHYGDSNTLERYAKMFNRPVIATEYAHALGLDFDKMESMWEVMYKNPGITGGAVWHFQDQGILRTADSKVDPETFTQSVWIDSINFYDTQGNKGCDGLVYSNRIPQVDYWQLRKVYAPVKALNDSIIIKPGSQIIRIRINNRFDFKDLSDIKCKWVLTADNIPLQEGSTSMKCTPHDTVIIPVSAVLPEKLSANYYLLSLKFFDSENYQFTEKTFRLWPRNGQVIANRNLVTQAVRNNKLNETNYSVNALFNKTLISIGKNSGELKIENIETNQLLLEGPFARAGRKNTLSSLATNSGKDSSGAALNWSPHILYNSASTYEKISPKVFKCRYRYERIDKKGEFIEGSVTYSLSDSGWMKVNYDFAPVNATGLFLEAGISFHVPAEYSEMRWIGNGPYPAYPGKSMLDEFGFYHLNSSDINYQGNRSNIQLMLMTDKNGSGFAISCRDADIAVERTPEGLIFSHNALVSGRYNKNSLPEKLYKAGEVRAIKGSFYIIPVNGNETPLILQKLFGNLSVPAVPFKPFYNSYDQ